MTFSEIKNTMLSTSAQVEICSYHYGQVNYTANDSAVIITKNYDLSAINNDSSI